MDRDNVLYRQRLPDDFQPCTTYVWELGAPCGSRSGTVIRFANHKNIGIYCDREHRRSEFEWITHDQFLPGGRWAHANVPAEYLSAKATKRRATVFRMKEEARNKAYGFGKCLLCNVPPLRTREPDSKLRWLKRYDRSLYRRIIDDLGEATKVPDSMMLWPSLVNDELRNEANDRVENSTLQADHLIPVEFLKAAGERLSRPAFNYAAKSMGVPLCGSCNRGRKTLEEFTVLEGRFREYFFGGNREIMLDSDAYAWFTEAYGVCAEVSDRIKRQNKAT